MSLVETKARLLTRIRELEVIDCHEHLEPEAARLSQPVDALNLLGHYTRTDLITAGMAPGDYDRLFDHDRSLEERWALAKPFWEQVRYGSYARAALIAARELYGCDDLNDETYRPLSEAMQERNRPGIYQWIFREHGKIRQALTQNGNDEGDGDLLIPVMWAIHLYQLRDWKMVEQNAERYGGTAGSLEEYVGLLEQTLAEGKARGVVGIKIMTQPFPEPEEAAARAGWEALRAGQELPQPHPLHTYLLDELCGVAAREGLVVATHAGVWGDFRQLNGTHMIPVFMRHPETRFDLYHLSFPQVHEAVVIAKNFPNVWTNLAWTHIVSPTLAREGMRELLDEVPVNKVLGFGGDYMPRAVDKVIGHLRMAQENIAGVLGERVEEGLSSEEEALGIARKWLWENPLQAYGLKG